MASSKDKAIELKDAYVSNLIAEGHMKQPEIKMPEVDHGEVALEPVTTMALALGAGVGALVGMPEIQGALGLHRNEREYKEAAENRWSNLNPFKGHPLFDRGGSDLHQMGHR